MASTDSSDCKTSKSPGNPVVLEAVTDDIIKTLGVTKSLDEIDEGDEIVCGLASNGAYDSFKPQRKESSKRKQLPSCVTETSVLASPKKKMRADKDSKESVKSDEIKTDSSKSSPVRGVKDATEGAVQDIASEAVHKSKITPRTSTLLLEICNNVIQSETKQKHKIKHITDIIESSRSSLSFYSWKDSLQGDLRNSSFPKSENALQSVLYTIDRVSETTSKQVGKTKLKQTTFMAYTRILDSRKQKKNSMEGGDECNITKEKKKKLNISRVYSCEVFRSDDGICIFIKDFGIGEKDASRLESEAVYLYRAESGVESLPPEDTNCTIRILRHYQVAKFLCTLLVATDKTNPSIVNADAHRVFTDIAIIKSDEREEQPKDGEPEESETPKASKKFGSMFFLSGDKGDVLKLSCAELKDLTEDKES